MKSKGFKFTRATAKRSNLSEKNSVDPETDIGEWLTGPDGTYIFAFIDKNYAPNIQLQILSAIHNTVSFPALIGDFMDANHVPRKGMNYLANP